MLEILVRSLSRSHREDSVMDDLGCDLDQRGQPGSSSGLLRTSGPAVDVAALVQPPPDGPREPIAGNEQPPEEEGVGGPGLKGILIMWSSEALTFVFQAS